MESSCVVLASHRQAYRFEVEKLLLVESASLAFPALYIVGQQVPGHGALHLAVDVMPRLPWPCRAHRLVVPNIALGSCAQLSAPPRPPQGVRGHCGHMN